MYRKTSSHRTSRGIAKAFLAIGMLALPGICFAQQPPAPAQNAQATDDAVRAGTVIRRESKLVLIDAVVTDKKGNYVRDLAQTDFKVYEDNKEQAMTSFTPGTSQTAGPNSNQKHYLVLFFDNSSMQVPDQMTARAAATKFIDANASPNNLMAVVEFGGALRVMQNFTANVDLLKRAASGTKGTAVASNMDTGNSGFVADVPAMSSISSVEADFGARTMLLALRSLAKNLRSISGRKVVVLISAGFPLTPEYQSELTATVDACNKSNVTIYALDARGLISGALQQRPALHRSANSELRAASFRGSSNPHSSHPRFVLAAYPEPQRPGGGGGSGGSGGTGGGTGGTGGRGGSGGTGGTGGTGGKGGTGGTGGTGGRGGNGGTTGGGGSRPPVNSNAYNNPFNQPRSIIPQLPPSAAPNQQILAALAEGTGGFTIFNTNDLLGGLQKIASEQNEFYLLGYVPPDSPEGSCHSLKVKMNRGGMNVRARSGYCVARATNPLEGTSVEKQLESRAQDSTQGAAKASIQTPFFYSAPNVAKVNIALDIPGESFHFEKEKGKYHANLNVLGIAYKPDGTIGAKFSDQVKLDLEKDEMKELLKGPYHYSNQFDAAPGNYKMTVVLNSGGDAYSKTETPLKIEEYDGKRLSLGSAMISNSLRRMDEIASSADLDAALLEDRSPLVVQGNEVRPIALNQFKKTDRVVLYSEIYEPLLLTENPPKVVFGYNIIDKATNTQVMTTGSYGTEQFIHKGSPVIPVGLLVKVSELKPGKYQLVLMAIDAAGQHAENRFTDFEVVE